MGTAIVVVLALVGVGIVIDQLFRLKNYLNRTPPAADPPPSDDDDENPSGN